jgi:molybdopterin/thiamine biosynthesis adenylyltransferase/nitroreductase
MSTSQFDYTAAYSRNIGWVTSSEQSLLRHKRVAIAGLGGVGGSHLLTLTRLGIGAFTLADFDTFEIANFNRQAGASLSTLGRQKTEVLAEQALDINPELDLKIFSGKVTHENVDDFLAGADLYLDGLDFFAVQARRLTFDACARADIPAVTAAPLGMGVALLNFMPGRMTFEDYFQLDGHSEEEQLLRFLLGLSPAMLQGRYLVDPSAVRLAEHRGPSTPMACDLCAGVAGTNALKILLGRGDVITAPRGLHFDAYRNRYVRTWRPGGNHNPLQRLGLALARRKFGQRINASPAQASDHSDASIAHQILELARWAPSGDNAQPWRFEVHDEHHITVHGHDTREHCVYDLKGHASQLSHGILLESIAIAASAHGLRADVRIRQDQPDTHPLFDVEFTRDPAVRPDPLLPCLTRRTVQRRPLSTRPLAAGVRAQLEASAGGDFRVIWFESLGQRLRMAALLYNNGGLRLTLPEAFETHKSVVQWHTDYSEDRIPAKAVGLDPLTLRLMRWAMKSWQRVRFLNTYMGGTLIPRIELDFIPGLACASHFIILGKKAPESLDDFVSAGRATQRFWLTSTLLGLQFQPEMTPLIFSSYLRRNIDFSGNKSSRQLAQRLAAQLEETVMPEKIGHAVFMGRLGYGKTPQARSVRLPLEELLLQA